MVRADLIAMGAQVTVGGAPDQKPVAWNSNSGSGVLARNGSKENAQVTSPRSMRERSMFHVAANWTLLQLEQQPPHLSSRIDGWGIPRDPNAMLTKSKCDSHFWGAASDPLAVVAV